MTNIKEIAARAGVSPSTVSRVLNGNGYVSEDKKRRVLAASEELDYAPNLNAVSLKRGATRRIGLVAPMFDESVQRFTGGFVRAAQAGGYSVTLFITGMDRVREREALEALRHKQVDALALVIFANDLSLIESYAKYGPIVAWQRVVAEHIPSVFMNQYDGYMLGLEHLYSRGYRRICNVYGSTSRLNTVSRMDAYRDFCAAHGLDEHELEHFYEISTIEDGERIARLWTESPRRPDAFIAANDYSAAGLVAEARRLGLSVPGDFAVCGFDNLEFARLLDLTTIHYPVDLQAGNAFAIIRGRIEDIELPLRPLQFHLVQRATT
ncbi:LacI family DNA-binding transcriptional regulator [Saccharibacillus sp. CPCC 101409]|uniref:LacI family DNA-binding transcriptional regulator n=1 Tax=Saccharibacillus sp. CPCC 101409 TaxID=3058041 RepID=UPI00267178EC|nr:LacI family DNA-binding transcriptional regulator [Saccharibacillus sp. CPCC 101409]MDO3410326.1 LacI family DNA-binding transcriptional regulator [Saccharibacillus sp. CPCC 101409]